MVDSISREHGIFSTAFLSEFHDSELVTVDVLNGKQSLALGFNTVDNKLQTFHFAGLAGFRITNFIQQNVVSRVLMFPGHPFSTEQLNYWINWALSVSDTDKLLTAVALKSITERIQKGELLLFVVEPSWGAEAAIICKSIAVQ